jgi:hypothetical protein
LFFNLKKRNRCEPLRALRYAVRVFFKHGDTEDMENTTEKRVAFQLPTKKPL